jgi:hypothetical protein
MREPHAFDHIRRYYWHHCVSSTKREVIDRFFKLYWSYMLRC